MYNMDQKSCSLVKVEGTFAAFTYSTKVFLKKSCLSYKQLDFLKYIGLRLVLRDAWIYHLNTKLDLTKPGVDGGHW